MEFVPPEKIKARVIRILLYAFSKVQRRVPSPNISPREPHNMRGSICYAVRRLRALSAFLCFYSLGWQ